MSGGLSFFKAAVVYLFLGGLLLGPVAGDRARLAPMSQCSFHWL
ncbi:putative DNA polymerase [Pseudomonas phage UF_RH6]|nr:putative DNA polymerase [Pseudomonas phage UF_RH6]